jgi:hypothetical protein
MESTKSPKPKVINIYRLVFQALKFQPKLFVPFIIFVALELLALLFIFVTPRLPFIKVFGPPVKTFFGEAFLHYPANFILLPKLASHARMVLALVFGSLLTGAAVSMVNEHYNKRHVRANPALFNAFKKYTTLFTFVLILTIIFFGSIKVFYWALTKYFMAGFKSFLFIKPRLWLGPLSIVVNIVIGVFIQGLFIYTIPSIMIDNLKLVKAIGRSLAMFARYFVQTITLVSLPVLVYIPIIILQYKTPYIIEHVFPEFVLLIAIFAAIMSSLVIDILITTSTTFLYLKVKDNK